MFCVCNKRLPEMFLLCTQNMFDRIKSENNHLGEGIWCVCVCVWGGGGGGGGGGVNTFMSIPPYNSNY